MKKVKEGLLIGYMILMCFYSQGQIIYPENSGVLIGNQYWSTKNLKVTTFRNGDEITKANSPHEFYMYGVDSIPAYLEPPQGSSDVYGYLYNGFAIMDSRNIVPIGQYLPSSRDYYELSRLPQAINNGGAGVKSTFGWLNPAYNGTNITGFNAFPVGIITSNNYLEWGEKTVFGTTNPTGFGQATISWGMSMGASDNFRGAFSIRTLIGNQNVISLNVSQITDSTATMESYINTTLTIIEKGVCWSKAPNIPTVLNFKNLEGADTGGYVSIIDNLEYRAQYNARAYAITSTDTIYGQSIKFTAAQNQLYVGAFAKGGIIIKVNPDNNSGLVCDVQKREGTISSISIPINSDSVYWGAENTVKITEIDTSRSTCAYLAKNLTIQGYYDWFLPDSKAFEFICNIDSIIEPKSYTAYVTSSGVIHNKRYRRIVKTMSDNCSEFYGHPGNRGANFRAIRYFNENLNISTDKVLLIDSTSASIQSTLWEANERITNCGICWVTASQNSSPTISDSCISINTDLGLKVTNLNNLEPGTTYYARAYAQNSETTVYGVTLSFTTRD